MTNKKNTQPDFTSTIERSLKAPWKHKALWFYGVLLAIFAAGGGSSNFGDSANEEQMQKVGDSLSSVPVQTWIVVGVVVAVVVLTFLVIGLVVSSWSQAALVNGAILLDKGKDFTRKEIGRTGKGPVWRLIKLNFFIPLLIILAILVYGGLILGASLVIGGEVGAVVGVVLGIASILALIPFMVYYGIVWLMASRFVVTEEISAFRSLKKAQDLLKGNFWMTFLLSLVAGLISGAGSCLGAILFIIFLLMTIGFAVAGWLAAAVIVGLFAFIGLIVLVIVAGYFRAFTETAMTLWWLGLKK